MSKLFGKLNGDQHELAFRLKDFVIVSNDREC
jgi:hypothetical protein